jgi:hypothetical protein
MRKFVILFTLLLPLLVAADAGAKEGINYGSLWNSSSDNTKMAFIQGYESGLVEGFLETSHAYKGKSKETEKVRELMKRLGENIPPEGIKDVMNDIYRDSANTLLPWNSTIMLAKMRIRGEPTDKILTDLRKDILKFWQRQDK